MKRSLTLIELIFTIVIIAFVFTVIPKMFQISNESLSFSTKEDAIFNMYSQILDIINKEYDENNTLYDDILLVGDNSILECNETTGYRVGGFRGSRNCFNKVYTSHIGLDSNEPPRDDIDDYNETSNHTQYEYNISSGHKTYTLEIEVGYTDNWSESDYSNQNLEFNFTNRSNNQPSHIKRVYVRVFTEKNISSIYYYSANIGHTEIKSIEW